MEGQRSRRDARKHGQGIPRRVSSVAQGVAAFVEERGGDRPVNSVLVANNGLGAVKFMRSVRMWAVRTFGNDKAVTMVAMATPEDIRINAEHLQLADQFVEVPGGTNNNNYANVRLIIQTAERAHVDAVWPGWGHASEDPQLPAALSETERGIRFLGPPSSAMAALGDKVGSTILAQAAGVPTYPWSGKDVQISFRECNGIIPPDVYDRACLQRENARTRCREIGYPVMLKASWGGGGKGIRTVRSDEEVDAILKQVQGEVPGSPIFAMKLASRCRHLEVQLLCDAHGHVCSLYSRDCSLQRRHQKIIEEGPVLNVPPTKLLEMEKSARALARSVGYVGAATVEYLYSLEEESYYFLELNPRLQVEHPVTEGITHVNLPACQLMVGMGIPLHRIPDIRSLYNEDPDGRSVIDFESRARRDPEGHVLAVRITSENANDGFKPTSGNIDELHFRPTSDVWGYFSVKSGGGIHEFSDSQFGHLFAKGATRQEAIRSMLLALKEVKIRGEIRTTVDYIIDMIQEPDFQFQRIHTAWLDNRIAQQIVSERPPWHLALASGAVVKAIDALATRSADYLDLLKKGQIPPSSLSLTQLREDLVLEGTKYCITLLKQGLHRYRVILNGSALDCVARRQADGGILLQVDGQKHVVYSENEAMGIRLSIDSWTCLLANESDPTQVLAPSAGKIRRYLVEDGAPVRPDEPYAELEVMKMLMQLLAPAAGTVHFQLPEGAVLNCGDLIARLELDDPSTVTRAVVSEDVFAESLGPPQVLTDRIDDRFSLALEAAQEILAGYERDVDVAVTELLQCLDHKDLAFICWAKKFSVAQSRLPTTLKEELQSIMSTYDSSSFDIVPDVVCAEFPAEDLLHAMHKGLEAAAITDRPALEATLQPLIALAEDHRGGKYTTKVVRSLLEEYLNVEERFDAKSTGTTEQDIIYALRHEFNDNLQGVLDLVISHQAQERRSDFVKALLVHVVLPSPADYRPILRRLMAVSSSNANQILKKAQYLLEQSLLADLKGVVARCLTGLELFTGSADLKQQATAVLQEAAPSSGRVARKATQTEGLYKGLGSMTLSQSTKAHLEAQKMAMLVEAPAAVDDALALLLDLPRHEIAEDVESSLDQVTALGIEYRALMTYIKRTYHHCIVQEPRLVTYRQSLVGVWSYEDPFFQGKICHGVMVVLRSLEGLQDCIRFVVKTLNGRTMLQTSGTFHVALTGDDMSAFALFPDASAIVKNGSLHGDCSSDLFSQDERVQESLTCVDPNQACRHIQAAIQAITSELQISHFHAVNVVIQTSKLPLRKGFLWHSEAQRFVPQIMLRNVESPVAASLELSKLEALAPHHRPSRNRQWHIYTVNERIGRGASLKRLYLRGALHQIGASPDFVIAASNGIAADVAIAVLQELESTLGGCLEELLRVQHGLDYNTTSSVDWAHIFLTLLPPVPLSDDKEADITSALRCGCASWVTRNIDALRRACVTQVEVKIHSSNDARPWRVAMSLPTGHESGEETVDIYREKIEGNDVVLYESQSEPRGALADRPVLAPYDALGFLQQKRLAARRHATTYCYDFPTVFASALREIWHDRAADGEPDSAVPGGPLAEARELSFEEMDLNVSPYDWKLREVEREPGRNVIGMVAWRMRIKTPEAPDGREIVAVANDITYRSGAFGPQEDALFDAAVKYALTEQLPVVYLAANSGARVGLAMDIREKIKVEWNKEGDPSKGYAYLYLDDADYQALARKRVEGSTSQQPLVAQLNEKGHWVLTDVIGHEDGLGVECLSGSGAIAGTFSKAFQQGFTITLVSGRTVGIGAYLARLGRRCVQSNHPIILTGFQALNKLLGREVYTSQLQLGGPRVMGVNGVSHHVVSDDLNGVKTVLKWLSYTPCSLGSFANRLPSSDPIDRPVQYLPGENEKLDPRRAIAGHDTDQGWIAGVFDRGTWMEAQEGWAQTVVTGRARLGGVAVAVIAVETQTVFKTVPADPGMLESSEQQIPQAGQVWFPDSALKTAQALEEFNLERLPLVILANWRGFSGGQRDLFEGVLQSGALIVENLRTYRQPVFVYLPPSCELRGGAWAVIDSKINGAMVEMYADPGARGGVLEPEGVVEIKFKKADLVKMMHRLDPELQSLTQVNADRGMVHKREQMLLPVYHQVALQFAEMHDTPNRMKAKGVIRDIVPWRHARSFLAQRLRRRSSEETTIKKITTSDPSVSRSAAAQLIKSWFLDALQRQQQQGSAHPEDKWQEDAFVHDWMMSSTGKAKMESALKDLQKSSARHRVQALLGSPEGTQGLLEALKSRVEIDSDFKAQVNAALRDVE